MTKGSKTFKYIFSMLLLLVFLGVTIWSANAADNGKITVTVTDAYSYTVIPGATVTVNGITATTGYDGSVTIETAAGTYTATASAYGYKVGSTSVTVSPGVTNSANLLLTPESVPNGKVTVTVTDIYSRAVIPGATVIVNGIMATTGYDGAATIEVAAGTYTVTASAYGYNVGSTSVTVGSGGISSSSLLLTPESVPNSKVTVTVTDTYSRAVIPGATVIVNGIMATTGYDGTATIEVAAGTYTVTASAYGYNAGSTSVTVGSGGTGSSTIALTPESVPNSKVTVKVTDIYSYAAIPGATVIVNGIMATTDYDGIATIETAAGTYTVTASAYGYNAGSTSVTVASGATGSSTIALTPESVPNGKVTVKVTDTSSYAVIPGATVIVNGIIATTDYDGVATIETAAGTYTVTASAYGYNAGSTSVTVVSGKEVASFVHLKSISANETTSTSQTGGGGGIQLDDKNPLVSRAVNETIKSIPGFNIVEPIVFLVLLNVGVRKQKKR
ncbi:carboxypeptidase regulatory-like domain-containing protein [uncultured Methanomethylovorans sp.]|uniref:carboxypeptidase regulatory-like domain-containing protein n=1 Tax=uncultured Methanomethylovorans sp. TaxID=183759 RepID=UPI002AA71194|nr:carboxypeptidase regulatory-like domain-containing protein [uncultured Methanomethylovorans sp.]